MLGSELIAPEAMRRTPFYQDLARNMGIEYMLGCVVHKGQDEQAYLSLLRGTTDNDFGSEEKRALALLLPHVQRAQFLQRQLAARESFQQTLDASPYGVVILDRSRRVLYLNRQAETIFSEQDGLALRHGAVRPTRHADQLALDRCIDEAVLSRDNVVAAQRRRTRIARPSGRLAYQAEAPPLRPDSETAVLRETASCIVFIHDLARPVSLAPEAIEKTHGLTRTEARICTSLFDGLSLQEAAERLDISRNTAKTHLRHIFNKCRVASQAQLIKLLALGLR